MPLVTIKMTEGRSDATKAKIAERVVDAVSELATVDRDKIWVIFEDVRKEEWVVGGPKPG